MIFIFIIAFLLLMFLTIFISHFVTGDADDDDADDDDANHTTVEHFTPLFRQHYRPHMRRARMHFEEYFGNINKNMNHYLKKNKLQ